MSTRDYLTQPYLHKLDAMRRRGEFDRPGQVAEVDVRHDDWCPALHGGLCRCNPDIQIRWRKV